MKKLYKDNDFFWTQRLSTGVNLSSLDNDAWDVYEIPEESLIYFRDIKFRLKLPFKGTLFRGVNSTVLAHVIYRDIDDLNLHQIGVHRQGGSITVLDISNSVLLRKGLANVIHVASSNIMNPNLHLYLYKDGMVKAYYKE